ncbi:MAG: CCA tRNA nucleotidyltransferase [Chloroflexi bacterium]|nr:CCA tRNA nucleotidyltransferase [Chloroflexota bacterium]
MNILDQVISFLGDQNIEAYLVGGLVRDQLLDRPLRDIDLALDGDAIELARQFADARGGAFYLMDEEHNVARVILEDTHIDFAQLRGDLRQDLATRDFTINAMARELGSNDLRDPFHGQKHLQLRQICAVTDEVFANDPVRLLRAIRLAGELGFEIGAHTDKLMRRDAHLLAFAPMERARDELFKILALDHHVASLRLADQCGVLGALLPELAALKGVTQSAPHVYDAFEHTLRVADELELVQTRGYTEVANGEFAAELQTHSAQIVSSDRSRAQLVRLGALLHDVGKAVTRSVGESGAIHFYAHESLGAELSATIARRLRLSNAEVEIVTRVVAQHLRPTWLEREGRVSNRAAHRFFRDAADAGVDVCILALADRRGTYAPNAYGDADVLTRAICTRLLDAYFRAHETVIAPPPLLDGRSLMNELRLEPGKHIGELLDAIREAQAAGEVNTREEAFAFARTQVNK